MDDYGPSLETGDVLIGYMFVPKVGGSQAADLQRDALVAAGAAGTIAPSSQLLMPSGSETLVAN